MVPEMIEMVMGFLMAAMMRSSASVCVFFTRREMTPLNAKLVSQESKKARNSRVKAWTPFMIIA